MSPMNAKSFETNYLRVYWADFHQIFTVYGRYLIADPYLTFRSPKGKRQFWGVNLGASNCNQWGLCDIIFSAVRGGDAALPKLLCDFLFSF